MNTMDVINSVCGTITEKYATIQTITNLVHGGWEGWMQVETALGIQGALNGRGWAQRETKYPGVDAAMRCDVEILNDDHSVIFVEMKVQSATDADAKAQNILGLFQTDITKITRIRAHTPINSYLAMAVMQNFDDHALNLKPNVHTIQFNARGEPTDVTGHANTGLVTLAYFMV